MKDFIYAALPWIIMGLTIAVLAVKFSKANSKKDNEIVDKSNMDDKKEAHNNKQNDQTNNNMATGMCIGMCLGVALSTIGLFSMSYGASFGMLIGMVVGMCINSQKLSIVDNF